MKLSLAEVEHATGAYWLDDTGDIGRIRAQWADGWSIDSRSVKGGEVFFAVQGEHFDGHAFVRKAFEAGALAAVVSRETEHAAGALLAVDNTVSALGELGRFARAKWNRPIVAVTGSAGKTSTKDIIANLLKARFEVGKTVGNLNNHIGLPLTLLRIPQTAEIAVIEMGMNHAGEIRALAEIAKPQVGVITNVGFAHIEAFESIEGIAAAKRELIEALPGDGVAVLNADDTRVLAFRDIYHGRVITYGMEAEADVRAHDVSIGAASSTFAVGKTEFATQLAGRHSISNILAGIAVGGVFGIEPPELVEAVARLVPGKMRGSRRQVRGITILDDSYNSNPEAARSMVDVLMRETAARRIAVLGEMLELGSWAGSLHSDLGRYAAKSGVDVVIGVGGAARLMVETAREAGMDPEHSLFFDEAASAGEWLRAKALAGDVILFKGSRGTHIERALARMEE